MYMETVIKRIRFHIELEIITYTILNSNHAYATEFHTK